MNFFEHQDKARKQSRWIIFAFVGTALLIMLAINLIVLFILGAQGANIGGADQASALSLLSPELWKNNTSTLLGSSAATGGIIGLASLGKIASLRAGGGKVARDMGATIVTPDTRDPLRRRLYNVVEEIALASGTPVPEVYVMENEPAINAFAAGYTPADAAIAVTQGTLEKLNRSELQGVIAHEFSHIFNGDMRINIRMMGVIFGVMVVAIIGKKFLLSSRHQISSSRNNNGAAIVAIGFAFVLVGYIGLFFARWMKSALSRQREYLADASAVQFTRDPSGISGALKKIAAYSDASYLHTDAEEVSHMLFGSGYRSLMFATHPPLEERISRLEQGFQKEDISVLARKLKAQEKREHIQAQKAELEHQSELNAKNKGGMFDVESMMNNIGNPEFERIVAAAMLSAELPSGLSSAARSLEWVPEVIFYCLLDGDMDLRQRQRLVVTHQMGDISEQKLAHLISANQPLQDKQRLPILEICFPTLKRRPITDIERILETINALVTIDNTVDSFEYLLSRLVEKYLRESKNPSASRLHGTKKLADCVQELSAVVSIVASHGQSTAGAKGIQAAQKAFKAGMGAVGINHTNLSFKDNWQELLDDAVEVLDQLTPAHKRKVVQALAATVSNDGVLVTAEHEMLRIVSSMIHVPLPILTQADLYNT